MKKNMFSFLIILFTVLLSGCSLNPKNPGGDNFEKDIYKGTSGVVLNIYNSLPDEVYEGETLNYVVKTENKGPYPVNNAKILVSLEKGYMQFLDGENVNVISGLSLEGKSNFNTFDDFEVREKTIKVNNIDKLSEYHDSVILTSFCYDYEGIAIADVCIDTDPYGTKKVDKACKIGESIGLSQGQGGPVVITNIETKMIVDNDYVRPQFKISIANQGGGTAIKPGSVDKVCNNAALDNDVYNSINLINVKFSSYGRGDFECLPEEIVLKEESDIITCTLKSGISKSIPSYKAQLRIEIAYGYVETLSKEIKIKKILRY